MIHHLHHFYGPHLPVLFTWVREFVWQNGHVVERLVRVPLFRL